MRAEELQTPSDGAAAAAAGRAVERRPSGERRRAAIETGTKRHQQEQERSNQRAIHSERRGNKPAGRRRQYGTALAESRARLKPS